MEAQPADNPPPYSAIRATPPTVPYSMRRHNPPSHLEKVLVASWVRRKPVCGFDGAETQNWEIFPSAFRELNRTNEELCDIWKEISSGNKEYFNMDTLAFFIKGHKPIVRIFETEVDALIRDCLVLESIGRRRSVKRPWLNYDEDESSADDEPVPDSVTPKLYRRFPPEWE